MSLFSTTTTAADSFLGIDIGSSNVKIVELKKDKDGIKLVNYAFAEIDSDRFRDWRKQPKFISAILKEAIAKSGMKSIDAVAALPVFSVFSSIISLPVISRKDMKSAVHWEAKKVMPLPLDEMILSFDEIEEDAQEKKIKILLTGAPKLLVKKHVESFREAHLNLISLEPENFALIRALLGKEKAITCLIGLGASTTDISVVENGIPVFNRSIDVGGESITTAISRRLNISHERADQFKVDMGLMSPTMGENSVPDVIMDSISPIINEIRYIISVYQGSNKVIEKLVLTGGSAALPGLTDYLIKIFNINTIIGDPWNFISCPVDLKPVLNEVGPRMAVACGLALRELV